MLHRSLSIPQFLPQPSKISQHLQEKALEPLPPITPGDWNVSPWPGDGRTATITTPVLPFARDTSLTWRKVQKWSCLCPRAVPMLLLLCHRKTGSDILLCAMLVLLLLLCHRKLALASCAVPVLLLLLQGKLPLASC